jgi:hypothetical protein
MAKDFRRTLATADAKPTPGSLCNSTIGVNLKDAVDEPNINLIHASIANEFLNALLEINAAKPRSWRRCVNRKFFGAISILDLGEAPILSSPTYSLGWCSLRARRPRSKCWFGHCYATSLR